MGLGGFLLIAGAALVLASVATAAVRPARWVLLIAMAGEVATGGGALARWWPLTVATWATGAYLAWRWARPERKARRR